MAKKISGKVNAKVQATASDTKMKLESADNDIVDAETKVLDKVTWMEADTWVQVKSSNVDAIRYRWADHELYVKFLSGGTYKYIGIMPQTAKALFDASSKGKFIHQRLKGKYGFQKLK